LQFSTVILAGGLGTRLRSEVRNVPKPMALVNGEPFLKFILDFWAKKKTKKFIISIGYLGDVIKDYFGDNFKGVPIEYVQESSPLGTGGGLFKAAESLEIEESFFAVNGDTLFLIDLVALMSRTVDRKADIGLALFESAEKSRYGSVLTDADGKILSFSSDEQVGLPCLENGGIYFFPNGSVLSKYPVNEISFSLERLWIPSAIKKGANLTSQKFNAPFIDIGVPEDYRSAGSWVSEYYTE
jgi:D-glycero-alpha-D-manno-heptose 1-phosphate guanylyltransferase